MVTYQKYIDNVLIDNSGGVLHLTQWNKIMQGLDEITLDREQVELLHGELGEILAKGVV